MGDRFDVVRREMQRQVDEGIRPSIQVAIDWRGELVFDEAVGADAQISKPGKKEMIQTIKDFLSKRLQTATV